MFTVYIDNKILTTTCISRAPTEFKVIQKVMNKMYILNRIGPNKIEYCEEYGDSKAANFRVGVYPVSKTDCNNSGQLFLSRLSLRNYRNIRN